MKNIINEEKNQYDSHFNHLPRKNPSPTKTPKSVSLIRNYS